MEIGLERENVTWDSQGENYDWDTDTDTASKLQDLLCVWAGSVTGTGTFENITLYFTLYTIYNRLCHIPQLHGTVQYTALGLEVIS